MFCCFIEIPGENIDDDPSTEKDGTMHTIKVKVRTSTPLAGDGTPIVDWDDYNDEPILTRGDIEEGGRAGKQVRFEEKVQKLGTPETSESNKNADDTIGKVEPLYKDDEKLMNELKDLLDEDDGLDTGDDISDIESDPDSPRKQEGGSEGRKRGRKGKKLKENNVKDGDEDSLKSSSSDSKRAHGSDDNYSDDFENSVSSDSTLKEERNENTEKENEVEGEDGEKPVKKVTSTKRGEYFDEEYACDDNDDDYDDDEVTPPMHDGDGESKKQHVHKAASHVAADVVSIKSLEEDKKYYLSDDESDVEERTKGPMATTFDEMNIIGPLATLLVKVRRRKRLKSAKGSSSQRDSTDGSNRTSGSTIDEEITTVAFSTENVLTTNIGSSSSLSSLNLDQLPTGKKKLDPIKKKKKKSKKEKKESSIESIDDVEGLPRQRKMSDSSIISREYIQATQEVVKSVLESQRQMAMSCKQVADSTQMVMASSKEVVESSKQVNESSKQVNESSKQVNCSSEQVIASSKHVIESAMHAVEMLKKTAEECKNSSVQDSSTQKKSQTTENSIEKRENTDPSEDAKAEVTAKASDIDVKTTAENEESVKLTGKDDQVDNIKGEEEVMEENDPEIKEDSSVSHASSRATDERSHNTDESTECADVLAEPDVAHVIEDTVFDKVVRMFDSVPDPDEPHDAQADSPDKEEDDVGDDKNASLDKVDTNNEDNPGKETRSVAQRRMTDPGISSIPPENVKSELIAPQDQPQEKKPILKRRETETNFFKPDSKETDDGEELITKVVPKTFLYMEYGRQHPFEENTYTETVEVKTVVKSPRRSPREDNLINHVESKVDGEDTIDANEMQMAERSPRGRIMSDSALVFSKHQEAGAKQEDTISLKSLDTSAEAEILVRGSLEIAANDLILNGKGKCSTTPRTDPDGQATSFQHTEREMDSPRGQLRRQAGMSNLYQATDPNTEVEIKTSCKKVKFANHSYCGEEDIEYQSKEIDADVISLTTSEEASLIVNRVVVGVEKELLEELEKKGSLGSKVNTDILCKDISTEKDTKKTSGMTSSESLLSSDKTEKLILHEHKTVSEAILHAGENSAIIAHVDIEQVSSGKGIERGSCEKEEGQTPNAHDHKTISEAILHAGETTSMAINVDIEKCAENNDESVKDEGHGMSSSKELKGEDSHNHNTVKEAILHAGETSALVANVDIEKCATDASDIEKAPVEGGDVDKANPVVARVLAEAGKVTTSVALTLQADNAGKADSTVEKDTKDENPVIVPEKVIILSGRTEDAATKDHTEDDNTSGELTNRSDKRSDVGPLPLEEMIIPSPVIDSPEYSAKCDEDLNVDDTQSSQKLSSDNKIIQGMIEYTQAKKQSNEESTSKVTSPPQLVKMKTGAMIVKYADAEKPSEGTEDDPLRDSGFSTMKDMEQNRDMTSSVKSGADDSQYDFKGVTTNGNKDPFDELEEEIMKESYQNKEEQTKVETLEKLEADLTENTCQDDVIEQYKEILCQRPSITITEASSSPNTSSCEEVPKKSNQSGIDQHSHNIEPEASKENIQMECDKLSDIKTPEVFEESNQAESDKHFESKETEMSKEDSQVESGRNSDSKDSTVDSNKKESGSCGNEGKKSTSNDDMFDFFDKQVVPGDDLTHIDVIGDIDPQQDKKENSDQKEVGEKKINEHVNNEEKEKVEEGGVKFFENGEEIKSLKEELEKVKKGKGGEEQVLPNIIIDGKLIDLDNLGDLDPETYKKVMSMVYNVDVMSVISEEQTSTSQSLNSARS